MREYRSSIIKADQPLFLGGAQGGRAGRKPPQGAALISMRDYDWSKSVRTPCDVRHSRALIGQKAYVHPVTYVIAVL